MSPLSTEVAMLAWFEQGTLPEVQERRKQQIRAVTAICLSKRQQRVVLMRFAGIDNDVIARRLDLTTEVVDSVYGQALDELQQFVDDFGSWVESERAKEASVQQLLRLIN